MAGLKQLIHEVHRRSLWQVLLIYVGGALVGYQAIQALTEGLGLPGWFPALAVLLFIVGLPIVLATSFVQEGFSSARQDPTLLPESGVRVAAEVAGAKRLFTWRNAILGGAIAFGLWGVGVTGWLLIGEKAERDIAQGSADRTSIAVLPFTDMSPGGDQAYFGDGVAEEILNALARIEGLRVAARTSAFKLRDEDVATVAERLNVSTVLEGSVRKQENRVRVTAQLINVADGFHLWSETFERELNDIFAVQDEIARAIAAALRIELTGEEAAALGERGTDDIDAYNAYLFGRYYWNRRTRDGLESAVEAFKEAIALDPDYALAYAGLADAYSIMAGYTYEAPHDVFPRAKAAALEALARDKDLATGHRALAFVQQAYEWDWERAEQSYRRALELDPENAFAHYWYSLLLDVLRRHEEAEEKILRAVQLDPLAPQIRVGLGSHYFYVRDLDRAEEAIEALLEIEPDFPGALWDLGQIQVDRGQYEEALRGTEGYVHLRVPYVTNRVPALAALGRRDEALALIAEARAEADSIYWDAVYLAYLYAALGDTAEVFNFLEQAYEQRSVVFAVELPPAVLDPYRSDPRYVDLMRRLDLVTPGAQRP